MKDASPHTTAIPLCVDLDGTLLKTDTAWELVMTVAKRHPSALIMLPFWAMRGKSYCKEKLAEEAMLDVSSLPYNTQLLDYLKGESIKGRRLVLVTGAPQKIAHAVRDHLGIFADTFSTGEGVNLTGTRKAELLVSTFGEKGFDYAGNAAKDLHVWRKARKAIVVNASRRVQRKAGKTSEIETAFDCRVHLVPALLKAIRPHQWLKNILIFVPVVTSHQLMHRAVLEHALLAFCAFSLTTSSVYLFNDLVDLSADRTHPRKRFRVLAAGDLPIPIAALVVPFFLIAGLLVANLLPPAFVYTLLAYFVATLAYSLWLKQVVIIDVLVLAGLYTVRILAGHAATGIPHSLWLLLFSMFFFLSLALVKRYSELESFQRAQKPDVAGRGYRPGDREQVGVMGSASGYIAALILALYITSDDVMPLYAHPLILWLLIPLIVYWISRLWLIAHRGNMHDDPVIFALRDGVSYVTGALVALVLFLAS